MTTSSDDVGHQPFAMAAPVGTPEEKGRLASEHFRRVDRTLVHQGAVVGFHELTIEDRNGSRFARDQIGHPGAVAVVPIDGDDIILVRQYRASIDADLLEIPAGKRDEPGEPPIETARRELHEEIGMRANRIEPLLNIYHSPGFCDEYGHLFLAQDLEPVGDLRQGPEELAMTVHRVPLVEAVSFCFQGLITDAKSLAGILAAARQLGV